MQQHRLTVLAEADLDGFGEYSLERWGENQAVVYLTKLVNIFPHLKDRVSSEANDERRRPDRLRKGLRRVAMSRWSLIQ